MPTTIRSALFSPVLPVAFFLNGQLYYLGTMDVLRVPPSTIYTGGFYAFLSLWGVLALLGTGQWRNFRFRLIDALVACFLLLVVASLATSHHPDSIKSLGFVLFFVAVPYTLARLLNPVQVRQLLWVSVVMGGIMFVWITAWFAFAFHGGSHAGRPQLFGFEHTPLLAGLLLGSSAILLTAYVTQPDRPLKFTRVDILGFLGILALLWMLQILGARGGFILTSFVIVVLLLSAWRASFSRRLAAVAVVAVFVTITFAILPANQARFFSRLVAAVGIRPDSSQAVKMSGHLWQRFESGETKGRGQISRVCDQIDWMQYHGRSDVVRKLLYRSAVDMFLRHPWRGVGAGGFGYTLCDAPLYFPHSTFLQAFAELGLPGGLLLISIAALPLYGLLRILLIRDNRSVWSVIWMFLPVWAFYVMADQLYGDYLMAFPFFLLTGAGVSLNIGLGQKGFKALTHE